MGLIRRDGVAEPTVLGDGLAGCDPPAGQLFLLEVQAARRPLALSPDRALNWPIPSQLSAAREVTSRPSGIPKFDGFSLLSGRRGTSQAKLTGIICTARDGLRCVSQPVDDAAGGVLNSSSAELPVSSNTRSGVTDLRCGESILMPRRNHITHQGWNPVASPE